MSLEEIRNGSLADPDVINNNFKYLDDRITDAENKIYTNNANFESKISTLNNNINLNNKNLDEKIKSINEDISSVENNLSSTNEKLTNIFNIIAPNYTKEFSISSGWVATTNGYVSWYSGHNDNSQGYLWINGIEVSYHSSYKYTDPHRIQYMVSKGDVITFSGKGCSAKFFPCKGA